MAAGYQLDALDRKLLELLRANARAPVTSLSHELGVSRPSVYNRIARLERLKVIQGYTVHLGDEYARSLIRAHVMLKIAPKFNDAVTKQLMALPHLTALYAISGENDMIAVIEAEGVEELNCQIDAIGKIDGVDRTTSSILLDAKKLR